MRVGMGRPPASRFFLGVAAWCFASLCAPAALAAGQHVSLDWSAPAGCPDADAIRRDVLSLAGPGATLDARADVSQTTDGFRAVVRVAGEQPAGERILIASSCEALARSVAVVLALSATARAAPLADIAPETAASTAAPPPVDSASANRAPPPPAIAPPPPANAAPPPSPPRMPETALPTARPIALPSGPALPVRVAAEGAVDVGTLPAPAWGAALRASIDAGRRLAFGVAGGAWLTQDGRLASHPTEGAQFTLLTLNAYGCYAVLHAHPIELSPCGLIEVSHLSATGFGATTNGGADVLWVAGGVEARGRWVLTRWLALGLGAGAVVPFERERFRIAATGIVYATSAVSARVELGPELHF